MSYFLSLSLRTDSNKFGYLSLNYPSSPPPFFFSFFLKSLIADSFHFLLAQCCYVSLKYIQAFCRPPSVLTKTTSRGSMSGSSQATSPVEDRAVPPTAPLGSHGSMGSMASIGSLGSVGSTTAVAGDVTTSDSHHQLQRRDSQGFELL